MDQEVAMTFEWDGGDLVLAKDFRLLFFVGSERSGTTLFGQILNYHPNCLIANESKFLEKVLRKGRSSAEAERMAALVDKQNPAVPDERRIEASGILREHDARVLDGYLEAPYVTSGGERAPGTGRSGS